MSSSGARLELPPPTRSPGGRSAVMGRKEGGRRPAGRGRRQGLEAGSHAGPSPPRAENTAEGGTRTRTPKGWGVSTFYCGGGQGKGTEGYHCKPHLPGEGQRGVRSGARPDIQGAGTSECGLQRFATWRQGLDRLGAGPRQASGQGHRHWSHCSGCEQNARGGVGLRGGNAGKTWRGEDAVGGNRAARGGP